MPAKLAVGHKNSPNQLLPVTFTKQNVLPQRLENDGMTSGRIQFLTVPETLSLGEQKFSE